MINMIPAEEFQNHIEAYYSEIWPIIIVVHLMAIVAIILAVRKTRYSDKMISCYLAFLWLFDGIIHQFILSPFPCQQGHSMGVIITLEGILLLIFGVFGSSLSFKFERNSYSILGAVLILYSLFIYPVIGYFHGFGYPKGPVLGLICPSSIFTFGFLMLTDRRMPKLVVIIPVVWALVGGLLAFVYWHVWADAGLVFAGTIGTLMLLFRRKSKAVSGRQFTPQVPQTSTSSNIEREYPMAENHNLSMFFSRLARFVLVWRWTLMVAIILLTTFFFYKMRGLRMDNSNEAFFVGGDQTIVTYNEFKEIFGNDEFVYILFETDDFFQPYTIKLIDRLAVDLEEHVPFVKDIIFLGNVEYIEGVEGGIEIYDLMEEFPETPEQMQIVRKKAMGEPLYLNNLISRDGKTAAIILEFEPYPKDQVDARRTIAPAVREILAKPQYASLKYYTAGIPIINHDLQAITAKETSLFMLICIVLEMFILFWTTRTFRGTTVPIMVVILAVLWTMGIIAILDWTLNILVIIVPTLLIAVGIGDSMHVIAEFQDQQEKGVSREEAIMATLALVGLPCLLTSLTTAAGFSSFLATAIKPIREMGVYTAIGVIMAFVLSLVVIPVFCSFGKERKKAKTRNPCGSRNDMFDRILKSVADVNARCPWLILGIFFLLSTLSIGGVSMIEVESNTIKKFSKDLPIRQSFDFVDSHMGGSMSVEIMADTGKKNGVKDPTFLQQLETLQDYIDTHPLTMKTISVVDFLKKMNQALHENRPEYYRLPQTQKQVSEYLFLYETSGGKELEKRVSFNYDITRLTARTKSLGTKDIRRFMADIDQFVEANLNPSIQVDYTGTISMVKALSDLITSGQIKSFMLAFIAIAFMMIIVLRSFKLGVMSMLPNLFPVLIALGFMGYAHIYLSMSLVTLAAIIIGIAVDDTVHFFVRYRQEFNMLGTYHGALQSTLSTVGRPITFTTMTLVAGFSVFVLSDMANIADFGLIAGFAILWALLADFFLAPAMMLVFKPLGPERQSNG